MMLRSYPQIFGMFKFHQYQILWQVLFKYSDEFLPLERPLGLGFAIRMTIRIFAIRTAIASF